MIEHIRLFRSQMEVDTLSEILAIRSHGVLVENPDTLNKPFVARISEIDMYSLDFYKCLAVGICVVGARSRYLAHVLPGSLKGKVHKDFGTSVRNFVDRFSGGEIKSFVAGGNTPLIDIPGDDYNMTVHNLVNFLNQMSLNPLVVDPFMIPPTDVYWGEKLYVVGDGVKPKLK